MPTLWSKGWTPHIIFALPLGVFFWLILPTQERLCRRMGTKISDDIDPGDAKEVVRHAVRLASRTRNLSRSIDVSTLVNSLPDAVADFYEPSAVDYIFAIKELSPSDASNKVLKSGRVVLPRGMVRDSKTDLFVESCCYDVLLYGNIFRA